MMFLASTKQIILKLLVRLNPFLISETSMNFVPFSQKALELVASWKVLVK